MFQNHEQAEKPMFEAIPYQDAACIRIVTIRYGTYGIGAETQQTQELPQSGDKKDKAGLLEWLLTEAMNWDFIPLVKVSAIIKRIFFRRSL